MLRHGIKHDDLGDAEREQWDEREWNAENEVPDEVDAAFAQFLNDGTLSATQIAFVEAIVSYSRKTAECPAKRNSLNTPGKASTRAA